MKMVLLRVGIDSGSGGMRGPLFKDGSFEFIRIPDKKQLDARTYGNTLGTHGTPHVEYFPRERRMAAASQPIHIDPEFETFTYGDRTRPKASPRTCLQITRPGGRGSCRASTSGAKSAQRELRPPNFQRSERFEDAF
ncbi:MAG: hypothetical protein HY288_18830 [Planctomycetia bacterium]|nr:hypothetical protein [Planctomycetia bacterium]